MAIKCQIQANSNVIICQDPNVIFGDTVSVISGVISILTFLIVYKKLIYDSYRRLYNHLTQADIKQRQELLETLEDLREILQADRVIIGLIKNTGLQDHIQLPALEVVFESKRVGLARTANMAIPINKDVLRSLLQANPRTMSIYSRHLVEDSCGQYMDSIQAQTILNKQIADKHGIVGIFQVEYLKAPPDLNIINADIIKNTIRKVEDTLFTILDRRVNYDFQ